MVMSRLPLLILDYLESECSLDPARYSRIGDGGGQGGIEGTIRRFNWPVVPGMLLLISLQGLVQYMCSAASLIGKLMSGRVTQPEIALWD